MKQVAAGRKGEGSGRRKDEERWRRNEASRNRNVSQNESGSSSWLLALGSSSWLFAKSQLEEPSHAGASYSCEGDASYQYNQEIAHNALGRRDGGGGGLDESRAPIDPIAARLEAVAAASCAADSHLSPAARDRAKPR